MARHLARWRLLAIALCLMLIPSTYAVDCYFPNGDVAYGYAPCGTNIQHCCYNTGPTNDDACFNNGFCFSWVNGYTYRGACTDKDWGDGCVQDCKDSRTDNIQPVSNCGGVSETSVSSPYVCCGTPPEAAECCSAGSEGGGFWWNNASIVNYDLSARENFASASVSLLWAATESSSSALPAHAPLPRLGSESNAKTTAKQIAPSAVASSPMSSAPGSVASSTGGPPSSPSSTDSSQGNNNADGGDPLERKSNQIALGCGLGIGLATLFVTAWGVYKQRSKISPIMFLKSPSSRRPNQKTHALSDQVPLQATSSSTQQLTRQPT